MTDSRVTVGVYGVGVGPGDPSLLTLRAAQVLASAALVIAPKSRAGGESIALGIAREHIGADCEVLEIVYPMTDVEDERAAAARDAADRLAAVAREGKVAALITLGDPMTYSTWGYTLRLLATDHPAVAVTTVPGITSYSAAAAALGEPLAEGDEPLLILPGTGEADLAGALEVTPNVVVLKAGRALDRLVGTASEAGATLSAVRRLGLEGEVVASDAEVLASEEVDYLTLAIAHVRADVDSAVERSPVLFVGAGPGDPGLITVRGRRALAQADLVVWAGSLVPEEVLGWTRPDCRIVDSAALALPEQVAAMVEGYRAGARVVRLHTGDPALFGATAEQWELLDEAEVPYAVIPGVSSLFGAAAALPAELTLPGVSQTVIVCRAAGRTPVPEGQDISSLAAHRATMAILLSAGHNETVQAQLLEYYPADTPAAIVQRATWAEERVERCTVATLVDTFEATGIDRTAMILVGDSLAGARGHRSHLYDPEFTHGYRDAREDGR